MTCLKITGKNTKPNGKTLVFFVKYGMISDEKFHEKALNFALLQNTEKEVYPIEDYKNKVKELQTDKHDKIVLLYANDPTNQDSLIQSAKSRGYDVLLFDNIIDNHFLQHLEHKLGM